MLIGAMIVIGVVWLGAMYMLITACIHESKLEQEEWQRTNKR